MRQETINIYTIEDHPNAELCYAWIRNNWHDLGQHCLEDMIESLNAFIEYTNADLDYSIGIHPDRGEFVKMTSVEHGKFKELYKIKDDYPLTGMCYDADIIEAWHDNTFEHSVLKILHSEGEYIYSDEGLKELCLANEYEFNEDGSFYS